MTPVMYTIIVALGILFTIAGLLYAIEPFIVSVYKFIVGDVWRIKK